MESPHRYGYFSHYHPGGIHPAYEDGHPKARDTPSAKRKELKARKAAVSSLYVVLAIGMAFDFEPVHD
jgi:hypothetical protein